MAKSKANQADIQAIISAKAVSTFLRTSPQKLSAVAALIRGMPVETAITQLTFCKKRIAKDVKKTLMSAVANAENNNYMDVDKLYISEIYVGKTLMMKRFRPRARGRSASIKKMYSRLTINVSESGE